MAKPARIISLDLGSQSIGLADFRVQPHGGIVLQDYLRRQVLAEPSGGAMREPQIAEVLREMLDALQIKNGEVNYAATGQSVFVCCPAHVYSQRLCDCMNRPEISTVIFDLDNTLWDWVDIWSKSFSAMLTSLREQSGLSEDDLLSDIRRIYQTHGTSEYAFLIEELECLRHLHPAGNLREIYEPAILAFGRARKEALHLYPTVRETLEALKESGCLLAAYTESMEFYTNYRIRKTGTDGLLRFLYSPADHDIPLSLRRERFRRYPEETYELKNTEHRTTPQGELKPNPDVLRSIMKDIGARPQHTIYVGDSLMKDIAMAQAAGVIDVYAKYGESRDSSAYELLRRVTHWPARDVQREKDIHAKGTVVPTFTLSKNLSEIRELFTFTRFTT